MKAKIVRIGNSKGIRLPKSALEQCGLKGEVDLEIEGNALIIRPSQRPRMGWHMAFEEMARQGDDQMLDAETATVWEAAEWEWK
jgi:antitoxin MazE